MAHADRPSCYMPRSLPFAHHSHDMTRASIHCRRAPHANAPRPSARCICGWYPQDRARLPRALTCIPHARCLRACHSVRRYRWELSSITRRGTPATRLVEEPGDIYCCVPCRLSVTSLRAAAVGQRRRRVGDTRSDGRAVPRAATPPLLPAVHYQYAHFHPRCA